MTFGIKREPEPKRIIWADETKKKLDDVRARKAKIVEQLDFEERSVRALCNHTYFDGSSAIEVGHDDDPYDGSGARFTYCTVCNSL
jgi:hypothetical protein